MASTTLPAPVRRAPTLLALFTVTRGADDVVMRWRSRVERASVVGLASVFLLFLVTVTPLLLLSHTSLDGNPPPSLVVTGGIATLMFVPIILALVRQLRTHGRQHAVRIRANTVVYESDGGLLPLREERHIALDRLIAVRAIWNSWVLTPLEGTPAHVARAATPSTSLLHDRKRCVRHGRLSLPQPIALEQWIQHEVAVRSGRAAL